MGPNGHASFKKPGELKHTHSERWVERWRPLKEGINGNLMLVIVTATKPIHLTATKSLGVSDDTINDVLKALRVVEISYFTPFPEYDLTSDCGVDLSSAIFFL